MRDHPNVVIRPPILFSMGFALGALFEFLFPLGPGLGGGSFRPIVVGLVFFCLGFALAGGAVARFRSAGTNVPTVEPTLALVTDGLYRLSRNPIYIGLTMMYFGLCVALTTLWGIFFLPIILQVLNRGVVRREEAYLSRKFPRTYEGYQQRVPRWI